MNDTTGTTAEFNLEGKLHAIHAWLVDIDTDGQIHSSYTGVNRVAAALQLVDECIAQYTLPTEDDAAEAEAKYELEAGSLDDMEIAHWITVIAGEIPDAAMDDKLDALTMVLPGSVDVINANEAAIIALFEELA